ncbi:MAG: hypothetical protein M3Q79_00050 [bacterium]|nr:hypothetical protein [bacterium]
MSEKVTEQSGENSQNKQSVKLSPQGYRVVYWTQGDYVKNTDRIYPTYSLWYQDSGSEPKQIPEVFGGSNDYLHIRQTQVSDDGKYVFLSYEKKVERVELDTADKKTFAETAGETQISGISLNNDGMSIVVAKTKFDPDGQPTTLDEFNVETLKAKRIFDGLTPFGLVPLAQNEQGVWLVQHPRGTEGFFYGTFDPRNAVLSEFEGKFLVTISGDGSALSYDSTSVSNPCDWFSGSSPTAHTIINPFTGNKIGSISKPGKHVIVQEFSEDGEKVLILIKDIPALTEYDESICGRYWDQENDWQLVSTDVKDTSQQIVANAGEAYELWNPDQPNPYLIKSNNTCIAVLLDEKKNTSNCEQEETLGIIRTVKTK